MTRDQLARVGFEASLAKVAATSPALAARLRRQWGLEAQSPNSTPATPDLEWLAGVAVNDPQRAEAIRREWGLSAYWRHSLDDSRAAGRAAPCRERDPFLRNLLKR